VNRILRLKKNESAPMLIRNGLRAEVVDDYTVRLHTDRPMVVFPTTYASAGYACITPKDYIIQVGDEEFPKKPVRSGPFRLVEKAMGESIELDGNESEGGGPAQDHFFAPDDLGVHPHAQLRAENNVQE